MATILIDPFPATGHYNGSLHLANRLREAGHSVVYTGIPQYQEKVQCEGYQFYPFFDDPLLNRKIIGNFRYRLDSFISIFNNICLKNALKTTEQYDTLIEKIKPDIILLDVYQIHKSVIYGKYPVRTIGFDTRVASSYAPNVPPYSSAYIPKNSFLSGKYVDRLWFLSDCRVLYRIFRDKILYFNNDLFSIYRKIAAINNVRLAKWKAVQRIAILRIVPENLVELVLTPKSFDFPRSETEQLMYIEPYINKRDTSEISERYLFTRNYILDLKKKQPDVKFIYASIGTVSANAPKHEARFIRALTDYCSKYNAHQIVFSIGKHYNMDALKSIPESIHIFDSVPQLDILQYCDLMITHGGTNSLIECVLNEVPVIVYPLLTGKTSFDQNGNAARVVYHQIGIREKISRMTAKSLHKNIGKICSHYEFYKRNIKSMKEKISLEATSNRAITIIESFLNKTEI